MIGHHSNSQDNLPVTGYPHELTSSTSKRGEARVVSLFGIGCRDAAPRGITDWTSTACSTYSAPGLGLVSTCGNPKGRVKVENPCKKVLVAVVDGCA